jgi:putative addiction module component (TIGR02574 family)
MRSKEVLEKALKLDPEERFTLVEGLIKSLDEPNRELDEIWSEEAEQRLKAYRAGKIESISSETTFNSI